MLKMIAEKYAKKQRINCSRCKNMNILAGILMYEIVLVCRFFFKKTVIGILQL